jgi:hypothetical protein
MIRSAILAASLFTAGAATAQHKSFEVCTEQSLCALRVLDSDTNEEVWLVTEQAKDLSLIWGGTYWIVDRQTYDEVNELIEERMVLPAKNPTTDLTLERAKGGSTPPPKTPAQSGSGGPLVSGSVSVGNITIGGSGGDASCRDCHTGSHREIHKKVMDKGY